MNLNNINVDLFNSDPHASRVGLLERYPWRFTIIIVSIAIAIFLALFHATAWSIVSIWMRSETFAHGFLIVPISIYLIWLRRSSLAQITPKPNFYILGVLAILGFVWLLSEVSGVLAIQQYSFVLMIGTIVWIALGNEMVWRLGFALAFLLFAVPVGEILLGPLMSYTADFTIAALRLTGIPVYREGLFFTVPSGQWSVVEACSGLRYLIASFTLGCLYAYLTYRSLLRRLIFIIFSIVVPIIANGLRAYMIVMIGHLSDMKLAVGVDHYIYGWVFFGFVMLLLFWVGTFWREDEAPSQSTDKLLASTAFFNRQTITSITIACIAAVLVSGIWPVYGKYLEHQNVFKVPMLKPVGPRGGWELATGPLTDWIPHFRYPRAEVSQVYVKDGQKVGAYIGYYNSQKQNAELINSQNVLVSTTNDIWGNVGEVPIKITHDGKKMNVMQSRLRSQQSRLLVWHWYWVEGRYTLNPYVAKLIEAKSKLLGRGDDAAVIIIYTNYDETPDAAMRTLQAFSNDMLEPIRETLNNANQN